MEEDFIKDKRVDKILAKRGYLDCEVFYSPISIWLGYFLMFILTGVGSVFYFMYQLWIGYPIIYLLVAYLLMARLNNSFALAANELIIINPNFPFNKFKTYHTSEIKDVTIDSSKVLQYFLFIFIIFGVNYVEVRSHFGKKRFYCLGLEEECYDEHQTEKTIEDLEASIKAKKVIVYFELY